MTGVLLVIFKSWICVVVGRPKSRCAASFFPFVKSENRCFSQARPCWSGTLLVMVTYIYRRRRIGRDLQDDVTEYLTTQAPRPRAQLTFLSFINITLTQLTSFFPTTRRGSSLFLEGIVSGNAARNNQSSFGSDVCSIKTRELPSTKAVDACTISPASTASDNCRPPLPEPEPRYLTNGHFPSHLFSERSSLGPSTSLPCRNLFSAYRPCLACLLIVLRLSLYQLSIITNYNLYFKHGRRTYCGASTNTSALAMRYEYPSGHVATDVMTFGAVVHAEVVIQSRGS
ncbi:hypothetical protein FPV67DRAFT_1168021 [Lyophyllum atratum]|nr:hypothetical protein FPV67DRAFT_1168021 [Lyophyllum atratum]